ATPSHAKLVEDRSGQREVPAVRLVAQCKIGIDGVEAGVLQGVGLELRHEADAATLLVFVNDDAAPFRGDRSNCNFQLVATVATQRPEHFSGEALRMDAHERSALGQIAENQCERGFYPSRPVGNFALEPQGLKITPPGGHSGGDNSSNRLGLRGRDHLRPRASRSLMRRTPRESSRCPSAFVESGKAYFAVAGSLDFVKSGFRFSRN